MSDAPVTEIDLKAFTADPYPKLARMRSDAPITYVPQLGATLITRRDDIHRQEKRIDVFSSHQPDGLMTVLMGENMMRKDGDAHLAERRALFPSLSPRTVRSHWKPVFEAAATRILDAIEHKGRCDLVTDYVMLQHEQRTGGGYGASGTLEAEIKRMNRAEALAMEITA